MTARPWGGTGPAWTCCFVRWRRWPAPWCSERPRQPEPDVAAATMLRTILIVDDSAVHRQMLGLLLKRLAAGSLGLRFAQNGRDALAILDTCPDVDLIILDLHMPH